VTPEPKDPRPRLMCPAHPRTIEPVIPSLVDVLAGAVRPCATASFAFYPGQRSTDHPVTAGSSSPASGHGCHRGPGMGNPSSTGLARHRRDCGARLPLCVRRCVFPPSRAHTRQALLGTVALTVQGGQRAAQGCSRPSDTSHANWRVLGPERRCLTPAVTAARGPRAAALRRWVRGSAPKSGRVGCGCHADSHSARARWGVAGTTTGGGVRGP
jgi:hypothetical protein